MIYGSMWAWDAPLLLIIICLIFLLIMQLTKKPAEKRNPWPLFIVIGLMIVVIWLIGTLYYD